MKLKSSLLGAILMVSAIFAVVVTAPTRANISAASLTENSNSPKLWQIFTSGNCSSRQQRKRANISRIRNNSCPQIAR